MSTVRRVRVVVRISPQIALKYEQLAQRFGYTRSELYRLGLDHGLAPVTKWCQRSSGDFGELLDQSLDPSIDSDASLDAAPQTPIGRLAVFAQALVASDFAADGPRVREALLAEAETVGLSRTQAEPYVHALASDVVRSARRRASGRGARSGARSQRPPARGSGGPVSGSSSREPSRMVTGSSSSSLDDVPELD